MPTKINKVIWDLEFNIKGEAEKLDSLSKKLDKAKNTMATAKKGSLEYAEAQKVVGNVSAQLGATMPKATSAVSGFGKAAKAAAASFGALFAIGSLAAVFRSGINSVIEFESALAELSAITGATGGDLEFFQEQAREIGATTTIGAQEAVNAFKLIGSARPQLLENKEALAAVSKEAIILAEAAKIDLPAAASALTTVMNQFNLSADQSRGIIDALANGSLKGAADIPTLTQTIQKAGTVLAQNNVTFTEAIALTETLADKQLTGAEAGTALRGVILKLTKEGKGYVDGQFNIKAALEQVRDEFADIEDPAERAGAAMKLFGEEGITAGNILLSNIDRFDELKSGVEESGAAMIQQAKNTSTLKAALTRVGNAYNSLILRFTSSAGPVAKAFTFIADNFEQIVKAIGTGIKVFIAYRLILAAVAVRTKLLAFLNRGAATSQAGLGAATASTTGKFKLFNKAIASNPIGLLVTVLSTAIAFLWDFADAQTDVATETEKANKQIEEQARLLRKGKDDLISILEFIQDPNSSFSFKDLAKFSKEDIDGAVSLLEKDIESGLANIDISDIDFPILISGETDLEFANRIGEETDRLFGALSKESITASNDLSGIRKDLVDLDLLKQEIARRDKLVADASDPGKKRDKPNEDVAEIINPGTIAELQKRAEALRKRLTQELRLDGPEFQSVKDEYKVALEELAAGNALLAGDSEGAIAGSIRALKDYAGELQAELENTNLEASNFEELLQRLRVAQAELESAQNRLKASDKQKSTLDEELSEQERHQLRMMQLEKANNLALLKARREFLLKRIDLMRAAGDTEAIEYKKLGNQLIEIDKEIGNQAQEQSQANTDVILEGIQQVLEATFELFNTQIEIKKQQVEQLIALQQEQVNAAQEIASEGNAELLQAEEERLNDLNKKREEFVRKQQALAVAQLIIESALAIAKAAAQGGVAAPFTIAATLIALASGLAQARALASQQTFFKGGYTGDGSIYSESHNLGNKPYTYHKGEFVMPHEIVRTGNNREWFEKILSNRVNLDHVFAGQNQVSVSAQLDGEKLDRIYNAIVDKPVTDFKISERGIMTLVERKKKKIKRIDTR